VDVDDVQDVVPALHIEGFHGLRQLGFEGGIGTRTDDDVIGLDNTSITGIMEYVACFIGYRIHLSRNSRDLGAEHQIVLIFDSVIHE
jgi:hypothetical protein